MRVEICDGCGRREGNLQVFRVGLTVSLHVFLSEGTNGDTNLEVCPACMKAWRAVVVEAVTESIAGLVATRTVSQVQIVDDSRPSRGGGPLTGEPSTDPWAKRRGHSRDCAGVNEGGFLGADCNCSGNFGLSCSVCRRVHGFEVIHASE